jgi:hypothetical protein
LYVKGANVPDKDLVKMTVAIPRTLWRAARIRAAEEDRDLRDVVIESLEALLGKARSKEAGGGKKGADRGVR